MIDWIKLIEEKREEILEAGIQAYTNAWESRNLSFIVEINEKGKIISWYDVSGGNSFHTDSYKVMEFCMNHWEIPDGENEEEYIKFDIEEYAAGIVEQEIDATIDDLAKLNTEWIKTKQ